MKQGTMSDFEGRFSSKRQAALKAASKFVETNLDEEVAIVGDGEIGNKSIPIIDLDDSDGWEPDEKINKSVKRKRIPSSDKQNNQDAETKRISKKKKTSNTSKNEKRPEKCVLEGNQNMNLNLSKKSKKQFSEQEACGSTGQAELEDAGSSQLENIPGESDVANDIALFPQDSSGINMLWNDADVLAEREGLDIWVATNLVNLFEQDNTIPFIARYRKELTKHMEPDHLRHAKETFDDIKLLKNKAVSNLKYMEKIGKLTAHIQNEILSAWSVNELDRIVAPFKTGGKRTLAAQARELGLEPAAKTILDGSGPVDISALINFEKKGLQSENDVKTGIQHIIAEIISKNQGLLDLIQQMKKSTNICLECSQAVLKVKKSKDASQNKKLSAAEKQEMLAKLGDSSKFKNYFNFSCDVRLIRSHQVLAINRGESLKELSVSVVVPEYILLRVTSFCKQNWLSRGIQYPMRSSILEASIKDSYKRLIEPLIIRQVRADLSVKAERASIEVFASNLKKLLLTPPFRGFAVLGIDPGFRNGCKVAVVAQSGEVLETEVLHIHNGKKPSLSHDKNALWLRSTLIKHGCPIIALGNGKACRETEEYLSNLIQSGFFKPELDVSYTIVNEQGASIYSCSEEAKKEFPTMDPNLISAVSLARRLQDPLAELVKIDPKHQGVGMYQHDIAEKKLSYTLNEVVIECVSFVGVDLNTASQSLLRRIAGLNASKADKILEYRKKNGAFNSREDLKKVKGIGDKTFEQCAGFVRILPETVRHWIKDTSYNPLDRTWIHPESYKFTERLLEYCHVNIKDFGDNGFIQKIQRAVTNGGGISRLAQHFEENESHVKLVIDGLQAPPNYDFRAEFEKPLFRKGLTSIDEIACGDVVTGKIMNTTDFGAFVDIGVGRNGLIHKSAMGGKTPQLGDRVKVKIINIEKARQRIGLQLLDIL